MSDHTRFDLDAAMNDGSCRAIDANWSPRKKAIVGVSAAVVAAVALGGKRLGLHGHAHALAPEEHRPGDGGDEFGQTLTAWRPSRAQYAEEARRSCGR